MSADKEQKNTMEAAKILYLDGMEVPDLAKMFDIPVSTLYNRISKEKWRELRANKNTNISDAPEKLQAVFVKLVEKLNDDLSPAESAKYMDAISKAQSAINFVSKDRRAFEAGLWMIRQLGDYIKIYKPTKPLDDEFFNKLDELLKGFQKHIVNKFSPN